MTMYMPVIYFPNIGEQSCLFFGVRYVKNVSLMEKKLNIFHKDKFIFKICDTLKAVNWQNTCINDNFGLLVDVVVVPYPCFYFNFR